MPDPHKEIIKAAKSGDLASIRMLLELDATLIRARDRDGSTPLHCAVWKGHQAAVEFILERGADVNAH